MTPCIEFQVNAALCVGLRPAPRPSASEMLTAKLLANRSRGQRPKKKRCPKLTQTGSTGWKICQTKKSSILLFPGRAITKHVVWKANEQVVREKKKKQFHNFTLRQLDDDGSYSDETVLSLNALFSFFIYHSVLIFVLSDGSKVISPWIPSVMCAKTRLVMGPVSRTSSASGAKERSTRSASLKHG